MGLGVSKIVIFHAFSSIHVSPNKQNVLVANIPGASRVAKYMSCASTIIIAVGWVSQNIIVVVLLLLLLFLLPSDNVQRL